MSATPTGSTPGEAGYIRGGGGVEINTGRLARLLAALSAAVLIALTAGTAVSTAHQNSHAADKFHARAVPVDVTVSGCSGISSGIAQAVQYYECRGTYTLKGQRYNEVIAGVRSQLPEGQTVHAVAAEGDPALVSTAGATQKGSYTTSIVLGAAAVLLIVASIPLAQAKSSLRIGLRPSSPRLSRTGGRRAGRDLPGDPAFDDESNKRHPPGRHHGGHGQQTETALDPQLEDREQVHDVQGSMDGSQYGIDRVDGRDEADEDSYQHHSDHVGHDPVAPQGGRKSH